MEGRKNGLPPDRNGRDSSTPVTPFQRKHHLTKQKNIHYKYSATFTTETFEEILQLLEKTAPIKCTMIEPKQASDYSYTRRTVIIEAR